MSWRSQLSGSSPAHLSWLSRCRGILPANIEEIRSDEALRLYGACLGVPYLATAVHFLVLKEYLFLTGLKEALCWPFFSDCYRYHVLTPDQALALIVLLGALSVLFALAFLTRRVALGWGLLLSAFALDALIIAQDLQFRRNQHYMLLWASLAFLFLPWKQQTLRFLIVSFYFWAGRLKLTHEWLSGSQVVDIIALPRSLVPAACHYVVFLEMVVVWGLLQPRQWLFWAALAQLLLFHLISISVVGFYYPVLMAGILCIFPLVWFLHAKAQAGSAPSELRDFLHGRLPGSLYATLGVFAALQLAPLLYPGDVTFTYQGRLFGLHMFEGKMLCEVSMTEKFTDKPDRILDLKHLPGAGLADPEAVEGHPRRGTREICDPIVYFERAQGLCRDLPRQDPGFRDLDLHMAIGSLVSPRLRPLIATDDFCSKRPRFNLIWPNDWLLPAR